MNNLNLPYLYSFLKELNTGHLIKNADQSKTRKLLTNLVFLGNVSGLSTGYQFKWSSGTRTVFDEELIFDLHSLSSMISHEDSCIYTDQHTFRDDLMEIIHKLKACVLQADGEFNAQLINHSTVLAFLSKRAYKTQSEAKELLKTIFPSITEEQVQDAFTLLEALTNLKDDTKNIRHGDSAQGSDTKNGDALLNSIFKEMSRDVYDYGPMIDQAEFKEGIRLVLDNLYEFATKRDLERCLEKGSLKVEDFLPNEQGTNRFGLDTAYFRKTINRELNRSFQDAKPDEMARIFMRLAIAADSSILQEEEFIQQIENEQAESERHLNRDPRL